MKSTMLLMVLTVTIITGCSSDTTDPATTPGRITITNNPGHLDGRMDHMRENIALQTDGTLKDSPEELQHTFTLVGEIPPLTTPSGLEIRATFVGVIGDRAYVTYNREGEQFIGGVEVVDISNPAYPVVISQALFDDTDLVALAVDQSNSFIYLTGARNPDISQFDSPAILERMQLDAGLLTNITTCYDVQSWVTNGIALSNDWICLSSGNASGAGQEGGIGSVALSDSSLNVLSWDGFNNSQFVTSDDDRIVALQIGASSMLRVYDRYNTDLNMETSFPLPAIGPVDGKNNIALDGNLAWIAMGTEGVTCIRLVDGSPVNWIDAPDPGSANPDDYISNGVSVDDDYLYIANGGGGLYICPLSAESGELSVGGIWDFQSSANFVSVHQDMVFVASGAGGLKILTKTANANPLNLALDFPRNDDSVSMGTPEILMTSNQITLESWCYLREVYDGMGLISYMTDHEGAESGYGFRYSNNKLRFCLRTAGMTDNTFYPNPSTPVELDQWMHIAGTYDGQIAKIYLNGVLVSEQSAEGAMDWDPIPIRFKLGKFYDSNDSRYMNGLLDEVRVWDVARTQSEIQENMNHVLSGHEAGLVGYWNFDSGPGNNVPDLTDNGSNGRLYHIYPANWVESGAGLLP